MPGNKNSGRKRKRDHSLPDLRSKHIHKIHKDDLEAPSTGRAGPMQTRQGTELQHTTMSNPIIQQKPKTSPLSNRVANQEFERAIGPSIQNIPENRLPQNRVLLQRWKGLQIQSQFNTQISTKDHARAMWPEIKAVWEGARLPIKAEKNCIAKIVDVIKKYQDLKRTPSIRFSEQYQGHLNALFDISLGEEKVEATLRSSRRESWEQDLQFYRGQKQHPQQFILGGVNLKEVAKEVRSAERKAAADKRAEKEAQRSASVSRYVKLLYIP